MHLETYPYQYHLKGENIILCRISVKWHKLIIVILIRILPYNM